MGKKINFKKVANTTINVAKKAGTYLAPIVGAILVSRYGTPQTYSSTDRFDDWREYRYSDAISAIMRSSMWSEDKRKTAELVKMGQSSDYYKAIVYICKSSMWSEDKKKAIEKLGE